MDNKDDNIKHYIFGLLSGLLFIPIIEDFINVIAAWIQVLIVTPSKIVTKANSEISEMQGSQEESTNVIGFSIPSTEEYYEDEYEDE